MTLTEHLFEKFLLTLHTCASFQQPHYAENDNIRCIQQQHKAELVLATNVALLGSFSQ